MDDSITVLIGMTSEPDCRFIGSWLMKVAEAQTYWSESLRDPNFENRVMDLCAYCEPNLESAALEVLRALNRWQHVLAADLYEIEAGSFCFEFGVMVQLGLFTFTGRSYQITIPEIVTLNSVRQAAFTLLSTASDVGDDVEVVQPEHLLHTLPKAEAEESRSRLIAMRRFNANAPRGQAVQ
jgi:hypothetical protein